MEDLGEGRAAVPFTGGGGRSAAAPPFFKGRGCSPRPSLDPQLLPTDIQSYVPYWDHSAWNEIFIHQAPCTVVQCTYNAKRHNDCST